MDFDKKNYKKYAEKRAKKSPTVKNCIRAFLCGGLICLIAQGLTTVWVSVCKMNEEDSGLLTAVVLVFVAAVLTGLGLFDKIAKFAGGGTLVPITGFANSVVSPAIDARAEGLVLGVGMKIFTVAGPVLLYGTLAGTIRGIIYWIIIQLR